MAPQQNETPAPAAAPETKPNLLDLAVDATLSREMNELRYTAEVSKYMAGCGFFGDTTISQSAVKVMLGKELGISPVVAMMSISIGKSGRPSMSGALHGALLNRAGYTWKFVKHDRTECTIVPYYGDKPILDEAGKRCVISFTYEDAKTALLTNPVGDSKAPSMYDKYGPDMLFNRVIVRFERRFAPGVTKGMVIYSPDELDEIEDRDLDAEIERKNAPGVAEVRAAQEVADRKIAEMKAEVAQVEPDTVTLAALVEPPPPVPARPPDAPRLPMPDTRAQRSLTMPRRGA